VLDRDLKADASEHGRILLHELFHFVWVRLGNPARREWEDLLGMEWRRRARGEAGWSAEWRKKELQDRDARERSRRWREYCCESFCDTAAWLWGGQETELTLARRWRSGRHAWFERRIGIRDIPI
jgi:hypothetical protein